MNKNHLQIDTKYSENNDLINFLDYNKEDSGYLSLFDNKKKKNSKNYSIFKYITSKNHLKLDPKEKIFQDQIYQPKNFAENELIAPKIIYIFRWRNIKAKLIFFKHGGPHKYLNLANFRFHAIKPSHNVTFKKYGGCRLEKNGQSVELFFVSKLSSTMFYETIRPFVILTDFQTHYILNKLIGKGSFARVYLARNLKEHEKITEVAVKIYNCKKLKNAETDRKLIVKEINILKQLNHENIITLLEVHEDAAMVFLVLELLRGGNFRNKILQPKLAYNEEYCGAVFSRLLKSLSYIHSQGIIHRDIKADNILLKHSDNDAEICIADFGLAEYFNEECDYVFKRCGTPGYVAPEILYDWKYDYKIDVFSSGVILYSLMSGRKLFDSNSLNDIVVQNYECEFDLDNDPALKKISPLGKDLLKKMLAKFPKDRYTVNEALNHQWFQEFNEKKLKGKKAILSAVDNTKFLSNYSFEKKNMPKMDMKLTEKTPLLRDFEGCATNAFKRETLRISNTTIIKKDDNRRIKLMDLPYTKKTNSKTLLKSNHEISEEENSESSNVKPLFNNKKNSLELILKKEEENLEIPVEGKPKSLKF